MTAILASRFSSDESLSFPIVPSKMFAQSNYQPRNRFGGTSLKQRNRPKLRAFFQNNGFAQFAQNLLPLVVFFRFEFVCLGLLCHHAVAKRRGGLCWNKQKNTRPWFFLPQHTSSSLLKFPLRLRRLVQFLLCI